MIYDDFKNVFEKRSNTLWFVTGPGIIWLAVSLLFQFLCFQYFGENLFKESGKWGEFFTISIYSIPLYASTVYFAWSARKKQKKTLGLSESKFGKRLDIEVVKYIFRRFVFDDRVLSYLMAEAKRRENARNRKLTYIVVFLGFSWALARDFVSFFMSKGLKNLFEEKASLVIGFSVLLYLVFLIFVLLFYGWKFRNIHTRIFESLHAIESLGFENEKLYGLKRADGYPVHYQY